LNNRTELMEKARQSIVDADEIKAMSVIDEAKASALDLVELLRLGFGKGNTQIGDAFEQGILSLPELLYSSEVMKSVTERVMDSIHGSIEAKGRILLATVEGDAHDIGKNIVASTLRANGFEVIDLGREVSAIDIIKKAEEHQVDIIGTSALLTTTLPEQRKLEQLLRELGLRDKYITMVGGAPCTIRWTKRIGADSYSEDAIDAVRQATILMEKKNQSKGSR